MRLQLKEDPMDVYIFRSDAAPCAFFGNGSSEFSDPNKGDTFVSNGDGISNQIEKDLRADMGGFMHPSKGDYSEEELLLYQ